MPDTHIIFVEPDVNTLSSPTQIGSCNIDWKEIVQPIEMSRPMQSRSTHIAIGMLLALPLSAILIVTLVLKTNFGLTWGLLLLAVLDALILFAGYAAIRRTTLNRP